MTEEQIKQMAQRFLSWKLPDDFNPDNGITYVPYTGPYNYPGPIGTNLFTATQAEAMVRYMVEGMTPEPKDPAPLDTAGESEDAPRSGEIDYTALSISDLIAQGASLPEDFPNYADWPVTLPAGHWRAIWTRLAQHQASGFVGSEEAARASLLRAFRQLAAGRAKNPPSVNPPTDPATPSFEELQRLLEGSGGSAGSTPGEAGDAPPAGCVDRVGGAPATHAAAARLRHPVGVTGRGGRAWTSR